MKKTLLIPTFTIIIASCATPYQKAGITGGYSDIQVGENIFQISFRGNGCTSRERASDFCLLRAAEVTLKNGYKYFVIGSGEKYSKTVICSTPSTSYTTGEAYGCCGYAYGTATTTTYGGHTYSISKPRVIYVIICFKEKPNYNGIVYNAELVVKSVKAKYDIK